MEVGASEELASLVVRARSRLFEMHSKANVGHFGGNLSCLDALVVLFNRTLALDDRFVLSKGHAAGALYVALWTVGRLSEDQLDTFHAESTALPGHVPRDLIYPGSFATGSLGHGLPIAAGIAQAAQFKEAGTSVFCLTSDGEWQEGSTIEAAQFAVAQKQDSLKIIVDLNGWQGFGKTSEVRPGLDLANLLTSLGIEVSLCSGHDVPQLDSALRSLRNPGKGPKALILKTRKGNGWGSFEDTLESHYEPPSEGATFDAS